MINFDKNGQGYFTFDEMLENEVIKEFFNGFNSISVRQRFEKDLFQALKLHFSVSGRVLSDVIKVEWNQELFSFVVIYADGEIFNYIKTDYGWEWF